MTAAKIEEGRLFRSVKKGGKKIGESLGDWAVWAIEQSAKRSESSVSARTTCGVPARSYVARRAENLEQIKLLLGHSSIQTTERYPGSEQEIAVAVNDSLGL